MEVFLHQTGDKPVAAVFHRNCQNDDIGLDPNCLAQFPSLPGFLRETSTTEKIGNQKSGGASLPSHIFTRIYSTVNETPRNVAGLCLGNAPTDKWLARIFP